MSAARPTTEPAAPAPAIPADGPQRLQKVLAAAGVGSRRHCEALILDGRVDVDGRVVTELGSKADPHCQQIRVDGTPLARPQRVYFAVHKPPGVVSTSHDPSGRPRVIDLVPYEGRLFTVGRLDLSSEGLMLVTNDGELANRLAHPRYGVQKTYYVEVAGTIEPDELARLRQGTHLAEGFARVVSARIKQRYKQSTLLEIVLAEGRNREIRRILARQGHKVVRLKRVALGPLRLADLPPAAARPLRREEVRELKRAAAHARRPSHAVRKKTSKTPPKAKRQPPVRTVIGGSLPSPGRAPGKVGARGKQHRRPAAAKARPRQS